MTELYTRAQQVIAWIGECSEAEKKCLECVSQWYDHFNPSDQSRDQSGEKPEERPDPEDGPESQLLADLTGMQKTLKEIALRPYFRRMWIVQEVTLARRVTLKCGECSLALEELDLALDQIFGGQIRVALTILPDKAFREFAEGHGRFLGDFIEGYMQFVWPFVLTRDLLATDSRDNIYALRGICRSLREHLRPPDYSKSDVEVYIETARASIIHDQGRLQLLQCARSPRHGVDLPTWCPDYGGPSFDNNSVLHGGQLPSKPESLPVIDGKRLLVKGVVLDRVAELSEAPRGVASDNQLMDEGDYKTLRSWFSLRRTWGRTGRKTSRAWRWWRS